MDDRTLLVTILDAVAEEIGDLGAELDNLQTLLSPAMFEIAKNADYVRNVQTLDLMSQRLAAISSFIFSLNTSIPDSCRVDSSAALGEVKLSALVERLTHSHQEPVMQASGDLDLF